MANKSIGLRKLIIEYKKALSEETQKSYDRQIKKHGLQDIVTWSKRHYNIQITKK